MDKDADDLPQELRQAGEAVGRLPRPRPPADLAARTLERLERTQGLERSATEGGVPARKFMWWRRQITHPLARAAAALALISTLGLFSHLDTAERVGLYAERLLGSRATDRLEALVDRMLVAYGPVEVREKDMQRLVGGERLPIPADLPLPHTHPKPKETPHSALPNFCRDA